MFFALQHDIETYRYCITFLCPACDFTTFFLIMSRHGRGFRELLVPFPVLSTWLVWKGQTWLKCRPAIRIQRLATITQYTWVIQSMFIVWRNTKKVSTTLFMSTWCQKYAGKWILTIAFWAGGLCLPSSLSSQNIKINSIVKFEQRWNDS